MPGSPSASEPCKKQYVMEASSKASRKSFLGRIKDAGLVKPNQHELWHSTELVLWNAALCLITLGWPHWLEAGKMRALLCRDTLTTAFRCLQNPFTHVCQGGASSILPIRHLKKVLRCVSLSMQPIPQAHGYNLQRANPKYGNSPIAWEAPEAPNVWHTLAKQRCKVEEVGSLRQSAVLSEPLCFVICNTGNAQLSI